MDRAKTYKVRYYMLWITPFNSDIYLRWLQFTPSVFIAFLGYAYNFGGYASHADLYLWSDLCKELTKNRFWSFVLIPTVSGITKKITLIYHQNTPISLSYILWSTPTILDIYPKSTKFTPFVLNAFRGYSYNFLDYFYELELCLLPDVCKQLT